MIPSLRMLRVPLLLFGFLLANSVAHAQQFIGAYTVYYRFNAGGCYGGGDPYFCSYIPPGPIHIDAAPGRYRSRSCKLTMQRRGRRLGSLGRRRDRRDAVFHRRHHA